VKNLPENAVRESSVDGGIEAGEQRSFVAGELDAGLRLDQFLAEQISELSRTKLKDLISQGLVKVNGVVTRPSHLLAAGERVEVELVREEEGGVAAENIPLQVLYEDKDVAVVNKPAGMAVHPGAGQEAGTLAGALLNRFGKLSTVGGAERPGIVHRLDKATSGVLIVAKTDQAHAALVEEFAARKVMKIYLALLHGKMEGASGRIELPVSRDLQRPMRMTTKRREGRAARTDWRLKQFLAGFSLVEARLHTGRTHQIRVHFAALGCPVVGDTLYGAPHHEIVSGVKLPELGRNFLHASRIRFAQPRTGKTIEARAPLPAELIDYLRAIRRALRVESRSIDDELEEYL
jgi:23S rRNA pseudouridine1911/1915/1917 synthase